MTLRLVPIILLLATACSNDHSKDDLRYQIELKDKQRIALESEVKAKQSEAETARIEHEKALAENQLMVQGLTKEVETKSAELASLEKNVAEKTLAVAELEKTVKESAAERQKLGAELDAERLKATSEKTKLEMDLATKKAELAAVESGSAAREAELKNNVTKLTNDLKVKSDEIVKLDEKIKMFESSPDQPAINEMINKLEDAKKELADLKEAKAKAELERDRNAVIITESMSPLWGMYYTRETFKFDSVDCRQYVYVLPNGDSTNAVVCDDGRMQWERRGVTAFTAIRDSRTTNSVGFRLTAGTSNLDSSCKANESVYKSGFSYDFNRSSRFGIADNATDLSMTVNKTTVDLESGNLNFTSNECEYLEYLATAGAIDEPRAKLMLEGAVRVCKVVNAQLSNTESAENAGCFMPDNTFVK